MTDAGTSRAHAAEQAAEWHAVLGRASVSAAELAEFRVWRSDPAHAAAYREVETVWRQSGALAGDPDLAVLTHQTLGRTARPARRTLQGWVRGGLATAVVIVGLGATYAWVNRDPVYTTGVGEQRTVRLSDGSVLALDTATRVKVAYSGAARTLYLLDGQALFTVTPDTARPFIVRSGETQVRAVDTVFEVRRETDGARVTLVSGVVEVRDAPTPAARAWTLAAGQQIDTGVDRSVVRPVDVSAETSWTEGRLVFADTPLAQAVAEVNRYLDQPIVLEGSRAASVEVNGAFDTGDRAAFAAAAVDLLGLEQVQRADGALLLRDRPPAK